MTVLDVLLMQRLRVNKNMDKLFVLKA